MLLKDYCKKEPGPRDFLPEKDAGTGEIKELYPREEIVQDMQHLEKVKQQEKQKDGTDEEQARKANTGVDYRRAPRRMEVLFLYQIANSDWFNERRMNFGDAKARPLRAMATSEIDDWLNHVDVVCTFQNQLSNYVMQPFAIDFTSRDDEAMVHKKLGWRHVYGRKERARRDVSEFELKNRERQGLKLPGFTSVKYYIDKTPSAKQDADGNWVPDPHLPRGRIEMMPKFVVGYGEKLLETLEHPPMEEDLKRLGEQGYREAHREHQKANFQAKWCLLLECSNQARGIYQMMSELGPLDQQDMDAGEVEKAREQAKTMALFFGNALAEAMRWAEIDPSKVQLDPKLEPELAERQRRLQIDRINFEKAGRDYAMHDPVCAEILEQCQELYADKGWRKQGPYRGRQTLAAMSS